MANRHYRNRNALRRVLSVEKVETRRCLSATVFVENIISQSEFDTAILSAPVVADVDSDGDEDVLASYWPAGPAVEASSHRIVWFENLDGTGTFGPEIVIHAGERSPVTLLTADVDSDSDLDVVAAFYQESTIAVFENLDSAGNFGDRLDVGSAGFPLSLAAADFDRDGDLDLAASHSHWEVHSLYGSASWYENMDGGFMFDEPKPLLIDHRFQRAWEIVTIDVDNDLDEDVVVGAGEFGANELVLVENLGGGRFGNPTSLPVGGTPLTSDIDVDGDEDVITPVSWLENTFLPTKSLVAHAVPFSARSLDVAHLDGDDEPDVVVAESDQIAWYANNNTTFQLSGTVRSSVPNSFSHVRVADIDGDGDDDVVERRGISGSPNCYFMSCSSSLIWHENRLLGDSNDDGAFNSEDFVEVLTTGKYGQEAKFDEGDWNQDGAFDEQDIVAAFIEGHYQSGEAGSSSTFAAAVDATHADDQKRAFVA